MVIETVGVGQAERVDPSGQFLQGDPQLQAGQTRPQAVVGALAEGEVGEEVRSVRVEGVTVGERRLCLLYTSDAADE